jgi:hypothetical protein
VNRFALLFCVVSLAANPAFYANVVAPAANGAAVVLLLRGMLGILVYFVYHRPCQSAKKPLQNFKEKLTYQFLNFVKIGAFPKIKMIIRFKNTKTASVANKDLG